MQNLRPLLILMLPYWRQLSIGLMAMLVTTACMLTLPRYLKNIFDNALMAQNMAALHDVMLLCTGLVLILVAGVFLRTYFIRLSADLIIYDFRRKIFAHTIKLDLQTFETRSSGEIISRLIADVSIIREFTHVGLPMFLRGTLLTFGTVTALLWLNPLLTAYIILFIAPVMIVARVLGKRWRKGSKEIQTVFASMSSKIEEFINGIRTVKTTNTEPQAIHHINTYMDDMLRIVKSLIFSQSGFLAFNICVGFIASMSVLYLGGREVILGNMTLGSMLAYLLYLAFLGDGASNMANFWPALNNVLGATERVFELMEEKPKITELRSTTALPAMTSQGRQLALENVTFHYASRPDTAVLNDVSLHISAGETVAIVGPSGAGKTTLFSLLLRLYDIDSGRIALDEVDINKLTFKDLRGSFATVSQDTHIFATTVAENIAYTNPNASPEEIMAAAKQANAHDFITALPAGYETEVGEKGVRLSGGQKQRLAIARAILQDAPILLLDEATSHLDAESERAVQSALEDLQQNRTVLVVAHRLATVKNADKIIVLDGGKIAASGTHKELMKSSALYKNLAELQFIQ